MIGQLFDQISKADVESLVTAKVREGRTLDYKQQLPDGRSESKREFLYDICSFVNASGGDVVFGVTDERDANGNATGLPETAEGLDITNLSEAIGRLENLVRDGITPRIQRIRWKPVDGFSKGPVLVARLEKSLIGPHMVTFEGMARFYSRNSTGKYPMDYREIRTAFAESNVLSDRLRLLRQQRVTEISEDISKQPGSSTALVLLHLIPLSAVGGFYDPLDILSKVGKEIQALEPIRVSSRGHRFNFDGFLVSTYPGPDYIQVYRSGLMEVLNTTLLNSPDPQYVNKISSVSFENHILNAITKYLGALERMGVPLPVFVAITLLNVRNFVMLSNRLMGPSDRIDRDVLPLPEVATDDYQLDVGRLLRPAFDALWQSCGEPKCLHYDNDGNWQPVPQ